MAVLDSQEQQQLEMFKGWWADNGKWLLMLLAITAGGFAAVQGWKSYRSSQGVEAFTLYQQLESQLGSNDPARINDAATAIMDNFSSTAYAPRAALLAAQANIQVNDMARAKSQLQWVVDNASEDGLQAAARLKLAAIVLDEKNFDEALKLLDAGDSEAYGALYMDARGDVLAAQGKAEEARAAYQQAYEKMDDKYSYRSMVKVKLDALGGAK